MSMFAHLHTNKPHTCVNTATTIDGHPPPPCEACAEMPRCSHGWRIGVDKCDSCAFVRFIAAYESMRRHFGDEYPGRFAECDELVKKHDECVLTA